MAIPIFSVTLEDIKNLKQFKNLKDQIDSLTSLGAGARGHWCAARTQTVWRTVGTITYDNITFSDSNMNITDTPLDINTGINSHKCYFYLDIDICHISGIFTVPVSGAWRVSYSMRSRVDSWQSNTAYLHMNGDILYGTEHVTYSESGVVSSTGGRVVTLEASAGDKIELRATSMSSRYYENLYCAEYIPKS